MTSPLFSLRIKDVTPPKNDVDQDDKKIPCERVSLSPVYQSKIVSKKEDIKKRSFLANQDSLIISDLDSLYKHS